MPDLFKHPSGAVALIESSTPGRMSNIEVRGSSSALVNGDADVLITGIGLSQQAKIAYFSTLGDSLYIYPLGNEISKCIITGMALPASICNSQPSNRDYSSAKKIIDFYNANKASNFEAVANPITLSIPPISLSGFIESMSLEIGSGSAEFGFAKFSINMSIIPK